MQGTRLKTLLLSVMLFSSVLMHSSISAAPPCDGSLKPIADRTTGYQLRPRDGNADQRCEGRFELPVSSLQSIEPRVSMIGCTLHAAPFEPGEDTIVELVWANPAVDAVRLRAVPVRVDEFYQMDAQVSAATASARGRFRWRTNVLARAQLHPESIRLAAWIENAPLLGAKDDADARIIILPLIVNASQVPLEEDGEIRLELALRNDGPALSSLAAEWLHLRTGETRPVRIRAGRTFGSGHDLTVRAQLPATGDDWSLTIRAINRQGNDATPVQVCHFFIRMPDSTFLRAISGETPADEDPS